MELRLRVEVDDERLVELKDRCVAELRSTGTVPPVDSTRLPVPVGRILLFPAPMPKGPRSLL